MVVIAKVSARAQKASGPSGEYLAFSSFVPRNRLRHSPTRQAKENRQRWHEMLRGLHFK